MSLYHELIAILNLNHTVNQELKQHFVSFSLTYIFRYDVGLPDKLLLGMTCRRKIGKIQLLSLG